MSNEFNEEEVDHDILEEYKVCAKCGAIYAAGNLNARRCNCGDSFQHSIFKVLQSKKDGEETAFNNINQCPCCGHKARAGVVKSLNVGKDEGTALLAQILYEAIDDGTETKKKISKISLKRKETVQSEIETSNVKQFLAFSDSRQQASFSAAFLDSKEGIMDNSYDLSRDLKIAISEYAPDSEIIVDGKKYTSKYISLPKTGEYPRNYFCTCPNCKKINVSVSTRTGNECKYCGEPLGAVVQEFYIEPINGFKTGITKESTRAKPKRSYAGEVSYLGGGIKDENIVSLSNAITIETSINDELLVMNKSSFNMCPICGYSDIVKGKVITPTSLKKHKNYRQFDCSCEELTQVRLGHRFQTDVARFTIPMLGSFTKEDYAIALSFMYAFLEGISIGLGIERNDIDGVLELNLEQHSYDILIYDNVPGGAGHVKRLVEKNAVITSLNTAYVKVSQQCCDENTSCYNCLRNYYNQTNHSKLKRKYARDFIESLLRQIGVRP